MYDNSDDNLSTSTVDDFHVSIVIDPPCHYQIHSQTSQTACSWILSESHFKVIKQDN